MNPRPESSRSRRSRKRWIVTWVLLLVAFVAAFLSPRKAKLRVQTDPNLALHWILVPESLGASTVLLGRDRNQDSLPELYLQISEPVGTNWEALLLQRELQPDFIQVHVLELAGRDGRELQRWPIDFDGPHGHVLGRDAALHFHARSPTGQDICLSHERCAGVFPFKNANASEFLLDGKPATLIESLQAAQGGRGSEEGWKLQVIQDGSLIRELDCGAHSRFILRPEYLEHGFCYRVEWIEGSDRTTCVRIDLSTGEEIEVEAPSVEGQSRYDFLDFASPIRSPNGELFTQAEIETDSGVSLFRIPLEPLGPSVEVANFPIQDSGVRRDFRQLFLNVQGRYLRLSGYFDGAKSNTLQVACTFFGQPERRQSIDSIPAMGSFGQTYALGEWDARVIPDQDGDQVEDIVVMLRLSKELDQLIGYMQLSGATGEILPR